MHRPPPPPGRRLRQATALLLLALALAGGVAVSMTRRSAAQTLEVEEVVLPSLRLVHEMAATVDEMRGLAALHLLRPDSADRGELEDRLQAGRLRIERRLAVAGRHLADDTEREHHRQVRALLGEYWPAQARLLAASRQAASGPASAPAQAQARGLLAGETQQLFQRLRTELAAWWAHNDDRARQAAQRSAEQARVLAGLVAGLAVLAAGAAGLGLWALRRPPSPPAGGDGAPAMAEPDQALDRLASQAQWLALNAAVVAARGDVADRHGPAAPGQVRRLAQQLGTAATALRDLVGPGTPDERTPPR